MIMEMAVATVMSGAAVCSDHFNMNREGWNHDHMSDHTECVIRVHYPEKKAGIHSGFVWVKIDDTYFSVPLRVLVRLGNKDLAIAKFKELVGVELRDHYIQKQIQAEIDKIAEESDDIRKAAEEAIEEVESNQFKIPTITETFTKTPVVALEDPTAQFGTEVEIDEHIETVTTEVISEEITEIVEEAIEQVQVTVESYLEDNPQIQQIVDQLLEDLEADDGSLQDQIDEATEAYERVATETNSNIASEIFRPVFEAIAEF